MIWYNIGMSTEPGIPKTWKFTPDPGNKYLEISLKI